MPTWITPPPLDAAAVRAAARAIKPLSLTPKAFETQTCRYSPITPPRLLTLPPHTLLLRASPHSHLSFNLHFQSLNGFLVRETIEWSVLRTVVSLNLIGGIRLALKPFSNVRTCDV